MPERIQLRRTKGFRKPEGAIVVARPTKWGNPFKIGEGVTPEDTDLWPYIFRTLPGQHRGMPWSRLAVHDRQLAVDAFTWWLIEQPDLMCSLDEIRGRDLACYCPLGQPCHADVLLELANQEPA